MGHNQRNRWCGAQTLPRRAIGQAIVVFALLGWHRAGRGIAWAAGSTQGGDGSASTTHSPDGQIVVLRIVGDDASTTTLIPQIAVNFLERRGARNARISPADPPWTRKVGGSLLSGRSATILIRSSNAADAAQMIAAGEADIGVTGGTPSPEEALLLSAIRDLRILPIARYPLIIAVHPSNPLRAISYDQLRAVYAGDITDWRRLGGSAGPIHPYGRSKGSGSRDTFQMRVMGQTPLAPSVRELEGFAAIRTALAGDLGGVAYLPAAALNAVKPLRLTVRGLTAAKPNAYGVSTGDYPLENTLILFRITHDEDELANGFFREVLSSRSLYLMGYSGFSQVGPRLFIPPGGRHPADEEYLTTAANALRINTTIRFFPGSTEINYLERMKLDALAAYLRRLRVKPEKLVHFSFCEDTSDRVRNLEISRQLGQVVLKALRRQEVLPGELIPLGAAMPLASDAIPGGQAINRRVETWIHP